VLGKGDMDDDWVRRLEKGGTVLGAE